MDNNLSLAQVIALIKGIGGTGSSGESGITNYNDLENKPTINGTALVGALTSEDLGLNEGLTREEVQEILKENKILFYNLDKELILDEDYTDNETISFFENIKAKALEGNTVFLILTKNVRPEVEFGESYSALTFCFTAKNFSIVNEDKEYAIAALNSYNLIQSATGAFSRMYEENSELWFTENEENKIVNIFLHDSWKKDVATYLSTSANTDDTYFKPEHKSQPVSKGFLDEELDEKSQIYYWDGASSEENPDNLIMFKNIIDKVSKDINCIIISNVSDAVDDYNLFTFSAIFSISKKALSEGLDEWGEINLRGTAYTDVMNSSSKEYAEIRNFQPYIVLYFDEENQLVEISKINKKAKNISFLSMGEKKNTEPFIATYDTEPLSKFYLDLLLKEKRKVRILTLSNFQWFTSTNSPFEGKNPIPNYASYNSLTKKYCMDIKIDGLTSDFSGSTSLRTEKEGKIKIKVNANFKDNTTELFYIQLNEQTIIEIKSAELINNDAQEIIYETYVPRKSVLKISYRIDNITQIDNPLRVSITTEDIESDIATFTPKILQTGEDYENPYMAEFAGSPVTKAYLEENDIKIFSIGLVGLELLIRNLKTDGPLSKKPETALKMIFNNSLDSFKECYNYLKNKKKVLLKSSSGYVSCSFAEGLNIRALYQKADINFEDEKILEILDLTIQYNAEDNSYVFSNYSISNFFGLHNVIYISNTLFNYIKNTANGSTYSSDEIKEALSEGTNFKIMSDILINAEAKNYFAPIIIQSREEKYNVQGCYPVFLEANVAVIYLNFIGNNAWDKKVDNIFAKITHNKNTDTYSLEANKKILATEDQLEWKTIPQN